jgi:hypothetical protein
VIHPTIELLGQDVRVLVEQATAVDPQRLGDFAGRDARSIDWSAGFGPDVRGRAPTP